MFIYENTFIGIKEGTVIYVKILGGGDRPPCPPSVVGPVMISYEISKLIYIMHSSSSIFDARSIF